MAGEGLQRISNELTGQITVRIPAGPGAPPPGAPAPPPVAGLVSDRVVDEAIRASAETGTVSIGAPEGAAALTFTAGQLTRIADSGKPLAILVGGVQFRLPPGAVRALAQAETAKVQFSAVTVEAGEAARLVAQAANAARVRLVGDVYDLDITAITREGSGRSVGQLAAPVRVSLPVPEEFRDAAAKGRLDAHRYNEASNTWDALGGSYDAAAGTITFETGRLSKYAVMETVPVAVFADIQNHWAEKDIELMADLGIARGEAPGKFNPDGRVTRAEFATFLIRSLGLEETKAEPGHFKDVPGGSWYYGAVETAFVNGLVVGYGDGTFRPNQSIAREEIAAMAVRALAACGKPVAVADAAGVLARFVDAGDISSWAREAAAQAACTDIVLGREGGRFAPKENATRAEAAVMLKRMLVVLGRIRS